MDATKLDLIKEAGYVHLRLYDRFDIVLPEQDWTFMCEKRWFSEEPEVEDVEVEFGVCGARAAKNDKEANEIVQKTVNAYKRFMNADIEKDCRALFGSTSRIVARMDESGHIYLEEDED